MAKKPNKPKVPLTQAQLDAQAAVNAQLKPLQNQKVEAVNQLSGQLAQFGTANAQYQNALNALKKAGTVTGGAMLANAGRNMTAHDKGQNTALTYLRNFFNVAPDGSTRDIRSANDTINTVAHGGNRALLANIAQNTQNTDTFFSRQKGIGYSQHRENKTRAQREHAKYLRDLASKMAEVKAQQPLLARQYQMEESAAQAAFGDSQAKSAANAAELQYKYDALNSKNQIEAAKLAAADAAAAKKAAATAGSPDYSKQAQEVYKNLFATYNTKGVRKQPYHPIRESFNALLNVYGSPDAAAYQAVRWVANDLEYRKKSLAKGKELGLLQVLRNRGVSPAVQRQIMAVAYPSIGKHSNPYKTGRNAKQWAAAHKLLFGASAHKPKPYSGRWY